MNSVACQDFGLIGGLAVQGEHEDDEQDDHFFEAGDAEFEFRVFVAGNVFGVFDDGEWGGRDEGVRFEAGAFFFGSFFSRGFVDFPSGSPCRAEDGDDECGDGGDGYVAIRGGIGKEWWEHGW